MGNVGMGNMGSMNMGMGNMGSMNMGMGNVKPWSLLRNNMNNSCQCNRVEKTLPNHTLIARYATKADCMNNLHVFCNKEENPTP